METTKDGIESMAQERANNVRLLLIKAIGGHVPEGYHLVEQTGESRVSLLVMAPITDCDGAYCIEFELNSSTRPVQGKDSVMVSSVSITATCRIHKSDNWWLYRPFGNDGALVVQVLAGDLVSAVRELVSQTCSQAMYAGFEWAKNDHDPLKLELRANGKKLQSIWKFGRYWGTLVGNSHVKQRHAKDEAEAAARLSLKSFHDERLADLR